MSKNNLIGVATLSIWADDHGAAVKWYTRQFGIHPYYERQGYAEFRVGEAQTELGIIDKRFGPPQSAPSGVIVYWAVTDVAAKLKELKQEGAQEYQPLQDRGNGFITTTVVDPFGNILGIMQNPHFQEMTKNE